MEERLESPVLAVAASWRHQASSRRICRCRRPQTRQQQASAASARPGRQPRKRRGCGRRCWHAGPPRWPGPRPWRRRSELGRPRRPLARWVLPAYLIGGCGCVVECRYVRNVSVMLQSVAGRPPWQPVWAVGCKGSHGWALKKKERPKSVESRPGRPIELTASLLLVVELRRISS